MTCRELLVALDLPRPAIVSMLARESDEVSSKDLLASTASGLDLHSTSSGRICDRQCGVTFAHVRTLSGKVVSVACSQDASLIVAAEMANVRSRCA